MINTKKFRLAVKVGDVDQVAELLREAGKSESRMVHGWTPLHVAVKRGKKSVVAAVLNAGADLNAMTDMHETPLDLAVRIQHKDIAEFLTNKGARSGAELCLHGAIAAGDPKAVKHVKAGADINQPMEKVTNASAA